MERYKNLHGNSGVAGYEIAADAIEVEFVDGGLYLYTRASVGGPALDEMKRLALSGRGLCTFISRHARQAYAARLR